MNIPKGGLLHCFENKTETTAHLLCTVVPAGLEKFFEEIGQPVEVGRFLPHPVMDKYISRSCRKLLSATASKYFQQTISRMSTRIRI
ncbi:hypothetical protein [Desertivirga brevis]|uniref:hypothetical protein n=1 Tax=Desertivirga brevis TaxID=2810310 RepID=UPI001A962833|nr:hypothetical protein [Pedobacter sp. SYSU D00873]